MVSVVIPAYNEEKTIARCLDSLVKQKTKQQFEVIVVDNASTDQTAAVALTYKNQLRLRVVSETKKGRGAARAAGFAQARGAYILSTDADTIVPINWIDELVSPFSDPLVVAVTGPCVITDASWFVNACSEYNSLLMRVYRFFTGHYWLSGFNFGIRKDIYERSGGFTRDLNSQEDLELSFRVKKLGTIKFLPHIRVVVSGRRFRQGMVMGLWPYVVTYINVIIFKKKKAILEDLRDYL